MPPVNSNVHQPRTAFSVTGIAEPVIADPDAGKVGGGALMFGRSVTRHSG
jgi:hypothetical protein